METLDFTDPKLFFFILIISIGALSYLGINMKEITINKVNQLLSSSPSTMPSTVLQIPSSPGESNDLRKEESNDDGILKQNKNRIMLSNREKLPPATNEIENTFGESYPTKNLGFTIGSSITPSVSSLLEKRGTKNSIQVFPSNSFSIREPIE